MFSLQKPTGSSIVIRLKKAASLPISYSQALNTLNGPTHVHVPLGFALDHTRSEIGSGYEAFTASRRAMEMWLQFSLGWVLVANPDAKIRTGEVVAVQAHAFALWSVNISRILYVIDEPDRFGFGYGTTALHVERGEERFLLEFDQTSNLVFYDLLAVSQPASWLVWLGYPFARRRQRKFARESHQRLKQAAMQRVRSKPSIDENCELQPGEGPIGLFQGSTDVGTDHSLEPISEEELEWWEGKHDDPDLWR